MRRSSLNKPFLVTRDDGLNFYLIGSEYYLSYSSLKTVEGWSEDRISQDLPMPCLLAPNPYNQRGAPMRLYRFARIKAKEASR
jgi:hypothetical protein